LGLKAEETLSGLDVSFVDFTQGCRSRSNPGLELANAFGVNTGPKVALTADAERLNAKGVRKFQRWGYDEELKAEETLSGLNVRFVDFTQGCRSGSNPGLEFSERLRR